MMNIRFMGVTTLLFDDGEKRILIDGFFTRPPLTDLIVLGVVPNRDRIGGALERAGGLTLDSIFVAHSHYDHAMDSATVADMTGAMLFGSESAANIARGEGLPEGQIAVFRNHEVFHRGQFTITVIETPHARRRRYQGTIDKPLKVPARVRHYREGGNYSFLIEHPAAKVLVVTSASYEPGMFRTVRADVVFLSIGMLGNRTKTFAEEYWSETVTATGAKVVVPVHWDDFMRSLDEPFEPPPRPFDHVDRAMKWIRELGGDKVRIPEPFQIFTPPFS
jgi:L-ascorbate metabolism protein UlaG (beta-lactamase superfamily)